MISQGFVPPVKGGEDDLRISVTAIQQSFPGDFFTQLFCRERPGLLRLRLATTERKRNPGPRYRPALN
jgi:hypothetical protein